MSTKPRKAPAFPLYADDFLAGTAEMTAEEVGGYFRLLCHQWSKGSIPADEERAGRIAGLMGSPSLRYVLAKFTPCDDGCLRNARLERVRVEQEQFRAKQAESGRLGAKNRWSGKRNDGDPIGKPMASPLAPPMANGCPPSPSPDIEHTPSAGAREVEFPAGFPKTEDEAAQAASMIGVPEQFARDTWNLAAGRLGMDSKGQPISRWANYLKAQHSFQTNRANEHAIRERNGAGPHGRATSADIRRSLVAGADDVQRQAERTAQAEREMVERGEVPFRRGQP